LQVAAEVVVLEDENLESLESLESPDESQYYSSHGKHRGCYHSRFGTREGRCC
jgi:hypothetical protein